MKKGFLSTVFLLVILGLGVFVLGVPASDDTALAQNGTCGRTVFADVVALDQPFYYNRLGAINANGMMYALARDVVVQNDPLIAPDVSGSNDLTLPEFETAGGDRADLAGQVALRADKRPRPLVLRVNEGDCLEINFTNLLDPDMFIFDLRDLGDFPTQPIGDVGVPINPEIDDQPITRQASIHIDGLHLEGGIGSDGSNVGANAPGSLVDPGASTTYTYHAEHQGTHLAYSMGSTLGGDGTGGTRGYGLFGAVNVQPSDAEWYRSQLTRVEMDLAINTVFDAGELECGVGNDPAPGFTCDGQPVLDYDATYPDGTGGGKNGLPIVAMLADKAGYDGEIVHTDINAVITGVDRGPFTTFDPNPALGDRTKPYREFTVIFHDEAKTVQAFPAFFNDPVLKHTLHGVRDSFPINYGSGGIGSEIIANRLGVGPMWDCAECKYEEFFLTSNTVGDPAMIVDIPANFGIDQTPMWVGPKATMALYPDDPSNVHHSYLNDRVMFRNLHAGPKEHHIFHLHAHQWLFNPNDPQSNYLDGQAIGPGSGYTYEIAYGGSGNRNKTAGDSIFHCHFYPHFAMGMWEMWRVHDAFEQGTELDQAALALNPAAGKPAANARALPDGEIVAGTPIPGLVPLPEMAMAPMPDAAATIVGDDLNPSVFTDQDGDGIAESPLDSSQWDVDFSGTPDYKEDFPAGTGFAGYPFYIPGVMGHRPPSPVLDMAFDGGLPRHIVTSGPDEFDDPATTGPDAVVQYQTRLDFNKILHHATALGIPETGTPAELQAMDFHDGDGDAFYDSYFPDGSVAAGTGGFEVNGLPAAPGAPFAEPCRTDPIGVNVAQIPLNRTIKGANIEMPVTLNRVGWHFQQQRFEALWEDVGPTLSENKAPEPMIMRLNSTDCAEFHHTNLVPNVYELDDYQVRTPTDIIGQHIHLVKFDVMSADGAANGFNYEDGTLSPDEVRERIEAFNHGGGLDGNMELHPAQHPWFSENTLADYDPTTGLSSGANIYVCEDADGLSLPCKVDDGTGTMVDNLDVEVAGPDLDGDGLPDQNWLGARTTIQRWYADPLLERSWDGGVGTVFTHDHYGPSTHQQVGLYSTLLVEPEGSVWTHNEYGYLLGDPAVREDGGPTTWQAIIEVPQNLWTDLDGDNVPDDPSHREFYFEFADFQHAYERDGGALGTIANNGDGTGIPIDSYADFPNAINPSFRQPPPLLEDIYIHPNWCPGTTFNADGTVNELVPRPCPEAISADDPGMYAVNFRNEPIALRIFEDANLNGVLDPGEDLNGNGVLDQVIGDAGDLALAFQSREDRAIEEFNVQPEDFIPPGEVDPISPYPPLTADVRPGDPWTPMLRAYMGDRLRIRVQVGAHEEEHNFTLHGMKWRQEANAANSGWKNSEFFGIDEYFNVDTPVLPDTGTGTPAQVDYFYTVGSEVEGIWNGVWGILRTYKAERTDLIELPNNDVGRNGLEIVNIDDFNGICPVAGAPLKRFNVTAVRAEDILPGDALVYNSRDTAVDLVTGLDAETGQPITTTQGTGPLIDPTALMYVLDDDIGPDGKLIGDPEPLILRVNAGDCVEVQLTNALPATEVLSGTEQIGWTGQPDMPGFSAFPPIAHKDENADLAGGITTFNYNDMIPSSYVGLHPQLLAFDLRNNDGFSGGVSEGKLVAPGESERYTWYAGDVRATHVGTDRPGRTARYVLSATPVEFGAAGLFPADRIKGTSKGMVGAVVVEPKDSCWITDPGTRSQASVWKAAGLNGACDGTQTGAATFRDFVTVMHNDVNLRYGGGVVQVPDPNNAGQTINHDCAADSSPIQCAVPNISAEGPLGPPEDPQDSGQKAINYGTDPLWFRLGIAPNTPFGLIHRNAALENTIPQVFSNSLVGEDPQTEVYAASPTGPQEGRVRLLMPGGHARGTTYTLHGHEWQRQPYINDSSEIGDNINPGSEYYGTQEGINPAGHWDIVTDLGGSFDVQGDYLFRDQASFGSYQGLWGLLRFNFTPPVAQNATGSTPKYTGCLPDGTSCVPGEAVVDLAGTAFDLDGDAQSATIITNPGFGTLSAIVDGKVTYTYAPPTTFDWQAVCESAFVCTDEFTYTVTDGQGLVSDVGTATVTVLNTAPVANTDTAESLETTPATPSVDILVLDNDTDAEGDLARIPLTVDMVDIVTDPFNEWAGNPGGPGSAEVLADGTTIKIRYTPSSDAYRGLVLFEYTVTDESGAVSNEGLVRVKVRVDNVTINTAQFQDNNNRWNIGGDCSDPGETITVYLGLFSLGTPELGSDVCAADGTWKVNGVLGQTAAAGDVISVVSTGGAIFEGFPVTIR